MVKASIIGKGNFGSKIENCIKEFVQFVEPDDAEWIIIATPNDLHYEQVEYWLSQRKNVFCEKPLTLTIVSFIISASLRTSEVCAKNTTFFVDLATT